MERDMAGGRSRQEEHQRLMEEAEKLPGVADVLEAYGRMKEFAGVRIGQVVPPVTYSTGGNEE